jgi:hypothetical protein
MIGKYKHKKRGTVYVADHVLETSAILDEGEFLMFVHPDTGDICLARVQNSGLPTAGRFVIYYEADYPEAEFWARPENEFFDGRYETA